MITIAGLICLAAGTLPAVKVSLFEMLAKTEFSLTLIGAVLLFFALILGVGLYALNRHQYLELESDAYVDEELLKETLHRFWLKQFPGKQPPVDLYLAKQKIHLIVPYEEQLSLDEVEKQVGKLLKSHFGYKRSFSINLLVK